MSQHPPSPDRTLEDHHRAIARQRRSRSERGPARRTRATAGCAERSARPPPAPPAPAPSPASATGGSPAAAARPKAQVAAARSILIIIWHLLSNPEARFADLGYGYYQARTDTDRKIRNHIRQIQALGFEATITKTT